MKSNWSLVLVLFLVACGGGEQRGPNPTLPPVDPDPIPGIQRPTFSDSIIRPAVDRVLTVADSILVSDHVGVSIPTICFSATYCDTDAGGGLGWGWDISDTRDLGLDAKLNYSGVGLNYSGVGDKDGVFLVQGQGEGEFLGFPSDSRSYGAWLRHNVFVMYFETIRSGTLPTGVPVDGLSLGYGASVGNDTGSRPSSNATWRGLMIGGERDSSGNDHVIRGDATLVYDVGRNDLDVLFTNVETLDTHMSTFDLKWWDLSVDTSGAFHHRDIWGHVDGRFYGTDHAEVGGVFRRGDTFGAYGARR